MSLVSLVKNGQERLPTNLELINWNCFWRRQIPEGSGSPALLHLDPKLKLIVNWLCIFCQQMLRLSIFWNRELLSDHMIDTLYQLYHSLHKLKSNVRAKSSNINDQWLLIISCLLVRGCVFAEFDFTQAAATVYKQEPAEAQIITSYWELSQASISNLRFPWFQEFCNTLCKLFSRILTIQYWDYVLMLG